MILMKVLSADGCLSDMPKIFLNGLEQNTNVFPLRIRKISGFKFSDIGLNGKLHGGTDFYAQNDPLFAPLNGIIERVGDQPTLAGKYIIMSARGVQFRFYHLSKIAVLAGQHVREGQLIGVTGDTGLVVGKHLHLEVWINGIKTDPELYNFDDMKTIQILEAGATFPLQGVKDYFALDGVQFNFHSTMIVDPLATVTVNSENAGTYPAVDMGPLEKYRHGADILFLAYHSTVPTHPTAFLTSVQCPDEGWPLPAFAIHEILHALCYLTGVKDTVHQLGYEDPRPYATWHVLIQQLKPYLMGGVTPPQPMSEIEVKRLYVLAFYREPSSSELTYWTGKLLADFLATAIKDRGTFLLDEIVI